MILNYFSQFICFVLLIQLLLAAALDLAKPGCKDSCGNNITIPYPFGIGTPNCFVDEWFEVVCHDNRPYLSKYYGQELGGEVVDVNLIFQLIKIKVKNPVVQVCEDKAIWLASNQSRGPFKYEGFYMLTFVGCGNIMFSGNLTDLQNGCTSNCDPKRKLDNCELGVNCCQFEIYGEYQQIYLNFSDIVISSNSSCAYAILGLGSLENPLGVTTTAQFKWKFPKVENNPNCKTFDTFDIDMSKEYRCECNPFGPEPEGNPYIINGCRANSASHSHSHSRKRLKVIVGCGTILGVAFLGTVGFLLYKLIKKRRKRELREKFFKQNGGILLQQQLSVDENMVDKVRFFTSTELDKATNYFHENRILGRGGQGTVYKGMLVNGEIVAVKKSKVDDKNQVEQFINEVVLLSQINHRNVVKLLGCCLETAVPLLVYEFIPNGTLYDLMHNKDDEFLMSWDTRLRIAIEVGGALDYLHSATSTPIYHRDIKSTNILLDANHIAKVSDFGISRHVTIDQTHLTTMVKGTFGYLDPEYFQSNQFTDKSDVYSFGVVLVELLTRQKPKPSILIEEESHLGLAGRFLLYMEEDRVNMILDTEIQEISNTEQVKRVAILAQRCLSFYGRKRPTMKEVATELESIKVSKQTSSTKKMNSQGGI